MSGQLVGMVPVRVSEHVRNFSILFASIALLSSLTLRPRHLDAGQSSDSNVYKGLVRVPPDAVPDFLDDSDLGGLIEALEQSLLYYSGLKPDTTFRFGRDVYSLRTLINTMEDLRSFLDVPRTPDELNRYVRNHFLIYRSPGSGRNGSVIYSAYYEHSLKARLTPDTTS